MNFKNFLQIGLVALCCFSLSNCGTIIGGSRYNAHIKIINNSSAKIIYNGEVRGMGSAMIKVKRRDADKFSFTLKDDNCQAQTFNYHSKSFRGWAFAGSLVGFTGIVPGTLIPLPWGVGVDLATGSLWKPDVEEKGVSKQDYKNFVYTVEYTGCANKPNADNQKNIDVIYLNDGSVVRGVIIEQIPNVHYKIKMKDGSIFVFPVNKISKITKE